VCLGGCEEACEGASGCGSVDGADHSGVTMRRGAKLFAVEPQRLGVVRDSQVPGRCSGRGAGGDEDVSAVEAARERVAWVGEGRLSDGVVTGRADELEGDHGAVGRSDVGRGEDELRRTGGSTNSDSDLGEGSASHR